MSDEKIKMTDEEKKGRIAELLKELRELQATPRSDWHAAFEAVLRIETHKYEDKVYIRTEEEIGMMPPRTDFVVLVEDEEIEFESAVFRMFRKINILEYKNPYDSLNERTIRKVCGYANLYIGTAEHEGDRPAGQVTISIFRVVKNPVLFRKMERDGTLVKDGISGIYHIKGMTDLPFQIVITSELEGDAYAAYRALTDRAEKSDVERIMKNAENEPDGTVLDHYGVLLNLIVEKNPQFFELVKGEIIMKDALMEMVKDRVDARVQETEQKTEQKTTVVHIRDIMTNLKLTEEQAMDALCIPTAQREVYTLLINKK